MRCSCLEPFMIPKRSRVVLRLRAANAVRSRATLPWVKQMNIMECQLKLTPSSGSAPAETRVHGLGRLHPHVPGVPDPRGWSAWGPRARQEDGAHEL